MTTIIGHGPLRRELRTLALAAEPPHALLLAGPESTGRRLLALEYAATLNCQAEPDARPCGDCRPCRLIADDSHPDVTTLQPGMAFCAGEGHAEHPDDAEIRICQVRGLIDSVARYPFEARYRVIVVKPADRLRIEAANTFLKTLEEPPGHTVFVLVSSDVQGERMLTTIRSRCRQLQVSVVPRDTIVEGLLQRGVDPAIAGESADAARGRPGRAVRFAVRPDLVEDRERLLGRLAEVAAERTAARFDYAGQLADRWRRDRSSVLEELDTWETFWEGQLNEHATDPEAARGAARALKALETARDDLEARVITRAALELMLLKFPKVTLAESPEG